MQFLVDVKMFLGNWWLMFTIKLRETSSSQLKRWHPNFRKGSSSSHQFSELQPYARQGCWSVPRRPSKTRLPPGYQHHQNCQKQWKKWKMRKWMWKWMSRKCLKRFIRNGSHARLFWQQNQRWFRTCNWEWSFDIERVSPATSKELGCADVQSWWKQ